MGILRIQYHPIHTTSRINRPIRTAFRIYYWSANFLRSIPLRPPKTRRQFTPLAPFRTHLATDELVLPHASELVLPTPASSSSPMRLAAGKLVLPYADEFILPSPHRLPALLVVAVHHVALPWVGTPGHARAFPDDHLKRLVRVAAEGEFPQRQVGGALP